MTRACARPIWRRAANDDRLACRGLHGGYARSRSSGRGSSLWNKAALLRSPGPNGAGKSTLAKAIVGLLPHVTGDISVDGRSIADEPADGARAGVGTCRRWPMSSRTDNPGKSPGGRVGEDGRAGSTENVRAFSGAGPTPARFTPAACRAGKTATGFRERLYLAPQDHVSGRADRRACRRPRLPNRSK